MLDLSDCFVIVAHFTIHLPRVLVGLHVVWDRADGDYREIYIISQLLKNVSHVFVPTHNLS